MEPTSTEEKAFRSPIAWIVNNSVTANFLMLLFLFGGAYLATQIKKEVYPELKVGIINIFVSYPAASPEEVDEGMVLAIEEQVRSLDGVKSITSHSFENEGNIMVELVNGADIGKQQQDIKTLVDSILSFPEGAERPVVSVETTQKQVISMMIYGDQLQRMLKLIAEEAQDELAEIPGITFVELALVSPTEIGIEVPLRVLRKYNLKLQDISDIVTNTSLDLPAGGIKSSTGEVLIRTKERRYVAQDFETIPIITNPDGTNILLGEIASIKEGFEESELQAFFEGKPAIRLDVYRVGDESPIEISDKVKKFAHELQQRLPETVRVKTWNDQSVILQSRIHLLLKNGLIGFLLILLFLIFFLEPKLAFCVAVGIPISIIGSFLLIYFSEISINRISLFAFILTFGVIINHAVLVGENIYQKRMEWLSYKEAAILGTQEMGGALVLSVMINIIAFLPLIYIPGSMGKILFQVPVILFFVFFVSLVNSLFVMPAWVAKKQRSTSGMYIFLNIPNKKNNEILSTLIDGVFSPLLRVTLKFRYLVLTIAFCLMFLAGLFFVKGIIPFSILPKFDSDIVTAYATLPYGTPMQTSREVQLKLVDGARNALQGIEGEGMSQGIYGQIGEPIPDTGISDFSVNLSGSHLVGVQIHLLSDDNKPLSGKEFSQKWRESVGELKEVNSLKFSGDEEVSGDSLINFTLRHQNIDVLDEAVKELVNVLNNYAGIIEIEDKIHEGKQQLTFRLSQEAKGLQMTSNEMGTQIRNAFYGSESLRQVRGREEMKILVRLPEEERQSFSILENFIIQTPEGGEIPISEATETVHEKSYTVIERIDGRRGQEVSISVAPMVNPKVLVEELFDLVIPKMTSQYPGLKIDVEGMEEPQTDFIFSLFQYYPVPIVALYVLLSIVLRSYLQPFVVILTIPFGITGAVLAHFIFGYEISMVSILGIIALTGVVIINSLILVNTINKQMQIKNMSQVEAIVKGTKKCFRPFTLTSLTTFFSLVPMIFEKSFQAQQLAPIAISLGIGILFSTFVIFFVVTSLYLMVFDIKKMVSRML